MFRFIAIVIFLSITPFGVSAHHSVGAFFDLSSPITIDGKITSMRWRNPHVLMTIEQSSPDGGVQSWQVTSGGPGLLQRYGVTKEIAALGDRVSVSGFPTRSGSQEMLGVTISVADGSKLPMFPSPLVKRFGLDLNPGVHITEAAAAEGAMAARSIFRVWTYGRTMDRPVVDPSFTSQALAGQELYNPLEDDPALRCEAQGMPILMDNPFPMEFTDQGEKIILELEVWDIERTIYMKASMDANMAGDQNAEAHRGTPLGYSVGHWEDSTLVVSTSDVDWAYFDDFGTPQSELIESVERFTLSEDESRLDYEVTITDPETLLEPLVVSWHWKWVPGEALGPYNCTLVE